MPTKRGTRIAPGIERREDGTYLVEVTYSDGASKRRHTRLRVARTKAEALRLQALLPQTPRRSEPASRLSLRDYAGRWLDLRALAPTTRERYRYDLAHVNAAPSTRDGTPLGDLYLDALEADDVRTALASWLAAGDAPATINGRIRTLRAVLSTAESDGRVRRNVAAAVEPVAEGRTRGRRGQDLTLAEYLRLQSVLRRWARREDVARQRADGGLFAAGKPEAAPPWAARALLLMLWTGMRLGELQALLWTDIRDGETWVARSASSRLCVERTRTKADDGRRTALHSRARRMLRLQRRWLVQTQHPGVASGRVFPGWRAGRAGLWLMSHTALSKPLLLACAEARCPELSPHAMRRACEDAMRRAGVDKLVRRAQTGWRSERAQGVYATVSDEERAGAAAATMRLRRKG